MPKRWRSITKARSADQGGINSCGTSNSSNSGHVAKTSPVLKVLREGSYAAASKGSEAASSMDSAPPQGSRPDSQAIDVYARGSRATALALASDAIARQVCKEAIIGASYSTNAQETRTAKLSLWDDIVSRARLDVARFTPTLIFTVMGILKKAGYRSSEQYLSVARQRFIEEGGLVDQKLELACNRANRGAKRGRGPSKQAQPLPMERFSELPPGAAPYVAKGYCHPRRALTVGSWWLLREIELSHVLSVHVRVISSEGSPNQVELHLPVSKTDASAAGCFRTHQCSCDGQCRDTCPVCAVIDQLTWLQEEFPRLHAQGLLPLFPDVEGSMVLKQCAADTFQAAAKHLGLPLMSKSDSRLFSGHTLRVTGAVFLASAGVDIWRIQALGRWGSEAIRLYLRDAHCKTLGTISLEAKMGRSLEQSRAELMALQSQAKAMRTSLAEAMTSSRIEIVEEARKLQIPLTDSDLLDGDIATQLDPTLVVASEDIRDKEGTADVQLVLNTTLGGKLHVIMEGGESVHPSLWSARCGWKFGLPCARSERTSDWRAAPICPRCFGIPRAKSKCTDDSESSGSDS